MGILAGIRHWFDKRSAVLTVAETTLEQMTKFNALVRSDPEDIIRAIDEFNCGYLAPMARLIGDYEQRDDKMRVASIKMASAVSRCGWSVRPKKGFEDDKDAARQVEVLERFWSTVRVTDAFKRNERGGLALLKEQMMSAQSYGFAVHDLSWRPLANGEIEATFTSVPLWKFENRTGELRYIPQVGGWDGVEMKRGEWMVSTGDGIGIAAAICACMKRLGLTNWLVFTDRCVLPLIHGKTSAAYGSEQFQKLQTALKNINRLARIVTDPTTDINAIQMDGGKQNPFGPLIDWCDRAIVTLYRGGDLGTISRPDAVGGLGQLDEVDALEQRSCVRITETLNEQVSSFVVDYVLNQELKAEIVIEPVSKPDVKQDMEIDDHLAKYGVKLSKTDALSRYGRAEAETEEDALQPPQGQLGSDSVNGGQLGFVLPNGDPKKPLIDPRLTSQPRLANETAFKTAPGAFKNAPRVLDGQGDPSGVPPSQIAKKRPSERSAVVDAFIRQNSDAAKAVKAVVDNPSEGAFAQLMVNLPALLPTDPALASVIADEMAKMFGESFTQEGRRGRELANEECRAENPATCRVHGTPARKIRAVKSSPTADSQAQACGYANVKDMMAKAETVASDRVSAIQDGYSGKCKAHEAVAVISENRPFNDAEGNTVDFGGDIIEHYVEGRRRRDNMPKIANLEDLPFAIKAVKTDTYGVTRLKYPHGTTPDPQNPPRGTQREYHLPTDHGEMKVFVYIQGGHINGWHVAK